ncbi:MAG TPA: hypothetical protein VGF97_15135 [Rhizomicrobium sp.]|jgi:hypothetical protein
MGSDVSFDALKEEADGGHVAPALGHDIFAEGDTPAALRAHVRDAVHCHFGDGSQGPAPELIRLHFVRDDVL